MKYKLGTVLLSGVVLTLILACASYVLMGKHTGSEDVCSAQKEKVVKMIKAPVPIWEKVIKLLVRM